MRFRLDRNTLLRSVIVAGVTLYVLYLADRSLLMIPAAIIMGLVFLMGNTSSGCSIYFVLPIMSFATIIVLVGIMRVEAQIAFVSIGAIIGIVLLMDRNKYFALCGLVAVGFSFSLGSSSIRIAPSIFLLIIAFRLLLTPELSRLFVSLSVLMAAVTFLLSADIDTGLLTVLAARSVQDRSAGISREAEDIVTDSDNGPLLTVEDTVSESAQRNRSVNGPIADFPEENFLDSLFISVLYVLTLVLVVSVASKMLKFTKGLSKLIVPIAIVVSIIIFSISGFLYLRSLPLADNLEFGAEGQEGSPMSFFSPQNDTDSQAQTGLALPAQENEGKNRLLQIFRWATFAAIGLLSVVLFSLIYFIATRSGDGASVKEEMDIEPDNTDIKGTSIPAFFGDSASIIESYEWLRRSRYRDLAQLTPYELPQVVPEEDREALKTLTDIYVPIKYGFSETSQANSKVFKRCLEDVCSRTKTS